MRLFSFAALSAAAVATLFVTSGLAQQKHGSEHAFSAATLTALPTTSWPTNGGNLYNQRYSPLKAIDRSNVARLKGVWRTRLRGSGMAPQYSGFAAPIVADGVAYISTGANDVFALSIDSGDILWQYRAKLDPNITSVCCGWNNKGVAISEDKSSSVSSMASSWRSIARPGKWRGRSRRSAGRTNFSITAAPLYFDGMVIIGFAGGDRGTRSRLKAYDAKDGRLIWTFYTIPGPGEPGHETWPKDNDAWKYGGAAIWQTPAVDLELGLVYFSTGNAAPDYNGAFRAGDNLYAASMLAIELATGKYHWHFQQVHHDIWDYDAVNPVVLMDVKLAVARERRSSKWERPAGRTSSIVRLASRSSASTRSPCRRSRVRQRPRRSRSRAAMPSCRSSSRSRPRDTRSSTTAASSRRSWARIRRSSRPASGVARAGRRAAYDPVQQRLFVCASSVINGFTGGGESKFVPPTDGVAYLGGATTFTRVARTGIIAALDVTTNKLAWRYQWPEQCYSGTLATAGQLLFVGRNDGRLMALDSTTGKQLWEFQTGAGMHAPASTFEHNGKQYLLAFSAGSALLDPRAATVSGCSRSMEHSGPFSRGHRYHATRRRRRRRPSTT